MRDCTQRQWQEAQRILTERLGYKFSHDVVKEQYIYVLYGDDGQIKRLAYLSKPELEPTPEQVATNPLSRYRVLPPYSSLFFDYRDDEVAPPRQAVQDFVREQNILAARPGLQRLWAWCKETSLYVASLI